MNWWSLLGDVRDERLSFDVRFALVVAFLGLGLGLGLGGGYYLNQNWGRGAFLGGLLSFAFGLAALLFWL